MTRRKKQVKVKPDDPIEAAFILHNQRHWTLSAIAGHLSVSKKTAERYIQLYKDKESRYWAGTRNKKVQPRTYGVETRDLVKHFKEEVPERSANTIHEQMRQRLGEKCPSVETIRRILRDLGLSKGSPRNRQGYIKFEREFPNDLWQIDFKGDDYFNHLGKLSLLAILDDCSRFVIAARWCSTQEEMNVILLLRDAFMQHGLPNDIVSDNGSQFRTLQGEPTTRYCRLLALVGVRVIFHAPNHPQSKGKLERWFGTVMSSFVPEARNSVATNPNLTLADFNKKFAEWLEWYNNRHKHSSLGKQAPVKTYTEHPNRVHRPLEIEINWDAWISDVEDRKVNKQNIISIEGKKYVLPPGHAGMRVRVRKLEDRFEIYSGDLRVDMILKRPSPSSSSDVVERVITRAGTFKFKRRAYYVGYQHAGKIVKIQLSATGKDFFVFHDDMLLTRMRIDDGSAY